MTSIVTVPWVSIVIGLLVVAIIGLTMLKVVATMFGKIFSRSVSNAPTARAGAVIPFVVIAVCVGIVATRGARVRTSLSAKETVTTSETVNQASKSDQSLREAMSQLSEARQQIHEAFRTSQPIVVSIDESPAKANADVSVVVEKTDETKPQEPASSTASSPAATSSETAAAPTSDTAIEGNSVATTEEPAGASPAAEDDKAAASVDAGNVLDDTTERAKRTAEVQKLIRSLLSGTAAPSQPATVSTKANGVEGAESENGGVMLFSMTPEDARQFFGEAGPDILAKLKSGMPKDVNAAYALVPLTSPMDSAVNPMRPLLAAGSLQLLADKIVTLVEPLTADASEVVPVEPSAVITVTTAAAVEPTWVKKPDGGRITVESKPVFDGGDLDKALADAVNEAYKLHAIEHFESVEPAIRSQLERVVLRLDDKTAQLCLVDRHFRTENEVFGSAGEKPFQIAYGLVQFPESVDRETIRKIGQSMQNDRLLSLGLAVGFAWLGVVAAGFGIRTWTRRTGLRRLYTLPSFGFAGVFLLSTIAVVGASIAGEGPHAPSAGTEPIVISVAPSDKA